MKHSCAARAGPRRHGRAQGLLLCKATRSTKMDLERSGAHPRRTAPRLEERCYGPGVGVRVERRSAPGAREELCSDHPSIHHATSEWVCRRREMRLSSPAASVATPCPLPPSPLPLSALVPLLIPRPSIGKSQPACESGPPLRRRLPFPRTLNLSRKGDWGHS